MTSRLLKIITAADPATHDESLDAFCASAPLAQLLEELPALVDFRRRSDNLYERVRAALFFSTRFTAFTCRARKASAPAD